MSTTVELTDDEVTYIFVLLLMKTHSEDYTEEDKVMVGQLIRKIMNKRIEEVCNFS